MGNDSHSPIRDQQQKQKSIFDCLNERLVWLNRQLPCKMDLLYDPLAIYGSSSPQHQKPCKFPKTKQKRKKKKRENSTVIWNPCTLNYERESVSFSGQFLFRFLRFATIFIDIYGFSRISHGLFDASLTLGGNHADGDAANIKSTQFNSVKWRNADRVSISWCKLSARAFQLHSHVRYAVLGKCCWLLRVF